MAAFLYYFTWIIHMIADIRYKRTSDLLFVHTTRNLTLLIGYWSLLLYSPQGTFCHLFTFFIVIVVSSGCGASVINLYFKFESLWCIKACSQGGIYFFTLLLIWLETEQLLPVKQSDDNRVSGTDQRGCCWRLYSILICLLALILKFIFSYVTVIHTLEIELQSLSVFYSAALVCFTIFYYNQKKAMPLFSISFSALFLGSLLFAYKLHHLFLQVFDRFITYCMPKDFEI